MKKRKVGGDGSLKSRRVAVTSANWVTGIIQSLEERGLPGEAMAGEAGLPAGLSEHPTWKVKTSAVTRLWAAASEATGDPSFGLEVAQRILPTSFGALGTAVLSSETAGQALLRIARFSSVISDPVLMGIVRHEGLVRVTWSSAADFPLAYEATEVASALVLRALRALCATCEVDPVHVTLRRPEPEDTASFDEVFGRRITFGASVDSLEFLDACLQQTSTAGDEAQARHAERQAEGRFLSWELRARDTIVSQLFDGTVSEQATARQLAVSRSLLQLRLSEEGTNYREIVRASREQLAREYLTDGRFTVRVIAEILGYSHTSAFSRAFKGWTGVAPRAFAASDGGRGSEN